MIIMVCTVPAAPGLRAAPSAAREPTRPCPIPASPAARPKPTPAPIALAALTVNLLSPAAAAPCAIAGRAETTRASVAKNAYLILFIFISCFYIQLICPQDDRQFENSFAGIISPRFRYAIGFYTP